MAIVLDTSVVVDCLRNHPGALDAVRTALREGERVAVSVLTKVEVLTGARPGEEPVIGEFLDSLDLIVVDEDLAELAGRLGSRYVRSHQGIDPIDYVIAATAQRLGAQLWTLNRKHFPMFDDLPHPYSDT